MDVHEIIRSISAVNISRIPSYTSDIFDSFNSPACYNIITNAICLNIIIVTIIVITCSYNSSYIHIPLNSRICNAIFACHYTTSIPHQSTNVRIALYLRHYNIYRSNLHKRLKIISSSPMAKSS